MKKFLPVVLVMLTAAACHRDDGPCLTCPPTYLPRLTVTAIDILPTYVRLNVATTDSSALGNIMLKRDTVALFFTQGKLEQTTNCLDYNLLPRHVYTYKAYRYSGAAAVDSSPPLIVTTGDTTSHDFIWQTYALGEIGSVIWDVAIINDSCVIVVGEIYKSDSAGQMDPTLYNAARWNGTTWTVERIYYPYQGHNYLAPLYSIFAFSSTDFWVGSNQPMHWNGTSWQTFDLPASVWNGWINKMWGVTGSDFYIVGNSGAIAHYANGVWQKLESGTTLDIQDIWGSVNAKTGQAEVRAVASMPYDSEDRKILKIQGLTVTALPDSEISTSLTGIWFIAGRKCYVSGGGIYWQSDPPDIIPWFWDPGTFASQYYKTAIRGNGVNDITVAGDDADILHFNGYRWKTFPHLTDGNYHRVAMKGNLIVAVGDNWGTSGAITIGQR